MRKCKKTKRLNSGTFMKCNSVEEYKNTFIKLYKQELALKDNRSYWEFQDNFVGELFDNQIRIKALKENNKELRRSFNETSLFKLAKAEYKRDLKKNENT